MIELGFPPSTLTVAFVAIVAKPAAVHIVDAMTADALRRNTFESLPRMTAFTANFLVRAAKWETRFTMIKAILGLRPPILFAMAFAALLSKLAFMWITTLMTPDALLGRTAILFANQVTALAPYLLVRALEWIVGVLVVKGAGIEMNDVSLSAGVISVATLAFAILDSLGTAMKTHPIGDVRVNFVVTVAAKTALRFVIGSVVAFLALIFKLGVSRNYFTGHYQSFNAGFLRPGRVESSNHDHARDNSGADTSSPHTFPPSTHAPQ